MEEEDESEATEVFDVTAIKRILLSFEKRVSKNQELRIKYPDAPAKFMESEIELNEEIEKLHILAANPDLYYILVEMGCVQTLLGLVSHENSDIILAVVDLLQELTDIDTLTESEEEAEPLINTLLTGQVIGILKQALEKLDEMVREENEGVHNILAIVENLTELKTVEVTKAVGEEGLLGWLLKRVSVRQYDPNKLYASEILAIVLQSNDTNQKLLGELNGIDTLLQALSFYKKKDPSTAEELETMENVFDCMCSALMFPANRDKFLEGEGPQLMLLMLKAKKLAAKPRTLKVLNHAMMGKEGAVNCTKFVEIYGLRSLFPLFMKTPKSKRNGLSEKEIEEHICSIVASLFRNASGLTKDRVIGKFTENDFEKVDRLMELFFKYYEMVKQVDQQIERERITLSNEEIPESEETNYLRRLDGGLYTLQSLGTITDELYECDRGGIRSRINKILNARKITYRELKDTLRQYDIE